MNKENKNEKKRIVKWSIGDRKKRKCRRRKET
jgi:hypothetical protein